MSPEKRRAASLPAALQETGVFPARARRGILSLLIFFAVAWWAPVALRAQRRPLPPTIHHPDPAAGRQIVQEILSRVPTQSLKFYGRLLTRDASGLERETPFRYELRAQPDGWQDVYQSNPPQPGNAQTLIITHRLGRDNQYELTVSRSPDSPPQTVTRLAPADTFRPFAGSDLWVCDLGLEFLHWPEQVLITKEYKKSRPCRVIDSINPKPAPGAYSRVRSWIDNETDAVISAEAFDPQSNRWKEFSIGAIEKVNGQWQVKKLVMRNGQTDTESILEFTYRENLPSPK